MIKTPSISRLFSGLLLVSAMIFLFSSQAEAVSITGPRGAYTNLVDNPPSNGPGPMYLQTILNATGCNASFNSSSGWSASGSNCSVVNTNNPQTGPSSKDTPSVATTLFDYSMGRLGDKNSCITCDFLSYFMIAFTKFSFAVYSYFITLFLAIAPITMAIWLAYRAVKLMVQAGEDGKGFLHSVVSKLALFFFIWAIAYANGPTPYLWSSLGPNFLKFAFTMSNDLREYSIQTLNSTTQISADFGCNGVQASSVPSNLTQTLGAGGRGDSTSFDYIPKVMTADCFTERVHMMGIASGTALAFSPPTGDHWYNFLSNLIGALLRLLVGLFIAISFTVSAIWLVFLSLDVVIRAMVTAAFAPVIVGLFLYQPTRGISTNAIKGLIGSLVTAVSISMVAVVAFALITNTVDVYNATYAAEAATYPAYDMQPVNGGDLIEQMRNFIIGVGIGPGEKKSGIPLGFGVPWFWYLVFASVSIFALGKKMIGMIEQAAGVSGLSIFADRMSGAARSVGNMTMLGGIGLAGGAALAGGGALLGGGVGGAGYLLGGGGAALRQAGGGALNALRGNIGSGGAVNNVSKALNGSGAMNAMGGGAMKGAAGTLKTAGKLAGSEAGRNAGRKIADPGEDS